MRDAGSSLDSRKKEKAEKMARFAPVEKTQADPLVEEGLFLHAEGGVEMDSAEAERYRQLCTANTKESRGRKWHVHAIRGTRGGS